MKKTFAPAAALALAVIRAVMALRLTEPGTGFFPAHSGGGLYMAALLAAVLLAVWLADRAPARLACAPDDATPAAALDAAPFAGVLQLLAAIGLAAGAGMAFSLRHRMWQPLAISAVVSALCLLLLLPATKGKSLRGGSAQGGLLLLPLTVYAMVALLTAHLAGRNILHVPENMYTLLGCALLLAAVYSESRLRVGLEPPLRTLRLMTAAALFLTATAAPMALLRMMGSVVSVTQAPQLDLVNLALLPLLWSRVAALGGKGALGSTPAADPISNQEEETA